MNKDTIRFIDRLYKDLYKSDTVLHHSTGNETDKFRNIDEYISNLESIHENASKSEERINTLKRLYFDKYVIKREDIPDSYFANQERIALERGFGHVKIDKKQKKELQDEVINNQKKSIEEWLDYFLSEDSKFYPFWAKYWAFQGMIKLGTFDKEKGTFNKRTKETTAPFADLNREALSKSIDLIISFVNKEDIGDKELEAIVRTGSFQKIYPYVLTNILSNNENIIKRNEGKWIKYDQGSNHMLLVKSLQGYNTGWCTAGEATAKMQLDRGDFYIYYTLDENGEYKVPRIAIRMENGSIGEIRGIDKGQNIEPNMEQVVEEKIKDFPDKDRYYKKVNDMKRLTELYNKYINKQDYTVDELRFLYEIDSKIDGFGYRDDPRIEEIIRDREIKLDLSKVFDCDQSKISLEGEDYSSDNIIYYGNLNLNDYTIVDGLSLPQRISGSLGLGNLRSSDNLVLPKEIGGNLNLGNLNLLNNISLPQKIGGSLYLNNIKKIDDIELTKEVGGNLYLYMLETANNLVLPETIGEDLILSSLRTFDNIKMPQKVLGDIKLYSLNTVEDLILPQNVGGSLELNNLKAAKNLVLPQNVGISVNLHSLTTVEGLTLPEQVGGDLNLRSLIMINDLELPQKVGGNINLSSLTVTNNLKFPENLGGSLFLDKLTTAKGVVLPKKIGGDLSLARLTTAEGLILPQSVGGSLSLNSLTTIEGLTLPQTVGGSLSLDGLTTINGLIMPQNIGKNIILYNLSTLKDVVFPKEIGGDINLYGLKDAEGLILPQSVGGSLFLDSLITAEGITLPQNMGGNLVLKSLTTLEGLKKPLEGDYRIITGDAIKSWQGKSK